MEGVAPTDAPGASRVTTKKRTELAMHEDAAAEINSVHLLARSHAESAVEFAIQCGQLLIEQKQRLKHGEFIPWIEKHCEFSSMTAQTYMRAAKQKQRGRCFSSLAGLLSYERDDKVTQPPRSKFIGEFMAPGSIKPDFDLPENIDPADWAYMRMAGEQVARIAHFLRQIDVATIVRGVAREKEFRAINSSVCAMLTFAHAIHDELAIKDPVRGSLVAQRREEARTPSLAS